jgi:NADH:ubiquinone oxidoreductase subunit F (NADH-binding)
MTTLAAPPTTRRLLRNAFVDHQAHLQAHGPLPRHDLAALLRIAEDSGLTGRGGAGFPTAVKVRAVASARGAAVVVGNAMEGEPLSYKDAVLVASAPHLVLDGLDLVGRALGARRRVLALGPELPEVPRAVLAAHRGAEVVSLPGGFVAGQESALVNALEGRPGLPRDKFPRVTERGVGGRPTLVLNAETLAHLALAARHGAGWYRAVGTPDEPGTSLFTVTGAVDSPGVLEAPRGTPLAEVLAPARPVYPVAVLVGGSHGAWVPASDLGVPLSRAGLAPYGASVGAGVLHVLGRDACPLDVAADIAGYLAGESAAQCGPCINGLPRMADSLRRLADGSRDQRLPAEIARLGALVTGRGACAHPDGSARFVASTMAVFGDHVAAHLSGRCPTLGGRR